MVAVRVIELSRSSSLKAVESRINGVLRAQGHAGSAVRLFRTQDGQIGYTATLAQVVPGAGGRKAFDDLHRTISRQLGWRRGRPAGIPTRQVKCRVPEPVYRKLLREARRQHVTPSSLAAELVARQVGV